LKIICRSAKTAQFGGWSDDQSSMVNPASQRPRSAAQLVEKAHKSTRGPTAAAATAHSEAITREEPYDRSL
jgi:hypothetical protein